MFLDAYAPGLTDNVQRCCWLRGYIEISHGGGASMVAQTNDTDHHLWVRKRFIEKQTGLMIQKARATGGGLVDLTREENIDIMIEVMSDVNLHLHAAKGYKKNWRHEQFRWHGGRPHLQRGQDILGRTPYAEQN